MIRNDRATIEQDSHEPKILNYHVRSQHAASQDGKAGVEDGIGTVSGTPVLPTANFCKLPICSLILLPRNPGKGARSGPMRAGRLRSRERFFPPGTQGGKEGGSAPGNQVLRSRG